MGLLKGLLLCVLFVTSSCHVHMKRNDITKVERNFFEPLRICTTNDRWVTGHCVLPVQCPAHVRMNTKISWCYLPSGNEGICCTTGQNHTDQSRSHQRSMFQELSTSSLMDLIRSTHHEVEDLISHEQKILSSAKYNLVLEKGSPSFGHFRNARTLPENLEESLELVTKALEGVVASRTIKERFSMSPEDFSLDGQTINLMDLPLTDVCIVDPLCDRNYPYRTIDGTCNNLQRPRWGSANAPLQRLLPPKYADGIWSPRISVTKEELPSPRTVSNHVLKEFDSPNPKLNLLLMQFGQFAAHDVALVPSSVHANGSGIQCCAENGTATIPVNERPSACFPIEIPKNDPFFSTFGLRCMNFVRSMITPGYDCALGYANQMNKVSHFIDGSTLYGSDSKAVNKVREFNGGKLKMFKDFGRDLMQLSEDSNACAMTEVGSACFHAGDSRANLIVSLSSVHTIFTREHNRIAEVLLNLNPHWTDEIIFQETRRIVIGEIQHIVYSELLPLIIGTEAMEDFGLTVRKTFSFDYDININPSIVNEFDVAAFRFGHSIVGGHFKIFKENKMDEMIKITEVILNPARLRDRDFLDNLLNSLMAQPIQNVDVSFTESLSRYLFKFGNPFGIDLTSINIQRGRDHGIASYNDYRELVGLKRAKIFEDFLDVIDATAIKELKEVYQSPDDVDLFVAGLLEHHVQGAAVGPTFKGIIADQFSRIRRGDRFFYEHGGQPTSFQNDQLLEIKKITMARIICDNFDGISLKKISPKAFIQSTNIGNIPVDCSNPLIPKMNLKPWLDELV